MVSTNTKLVKYRSWQDDASGRTWKQWLHELMGEKNASADINAVVLEVLINKLLLSCVGEQNISKYFVKFGILYTEKNGRQVSN